MEYTPASYPLGRSAKLALFCIILVYLLLGSLYAVNTPAWQSPDEPAHYNYIVHIATEGRLPVLEMGDYPSDYLEELKAARFPSELSIDSIRYESHQPPLYYVMAAPVYLCAQAVGFDPLIVLRLFSVLLEALALSAGFVALHSLLRGRTLLTALAIGLAALIPMHVSITAAVNSDVMTELLIALVALYVVRARGMWTLRRCAMLGFLLGLCALTKLQTCTAGAFSAFALYYEATEGTFLPTKLNRSWIGRFAVVAGVALIVLTPWLIRNGVVYGAGDLLALGRHGQVVVGQLTTGEYLAEHGLLAWFEAFATTTFHSFWGQFGWMGVVLDRRIYAFYGCISLIALGGVIHGLIRRHKDGTRIDRYALGIVSTWLLVTTAGYLWWNLSFVQHQGRYLFPALLPLCLGMAWGFEQALLARPWTRLALGLISGFVMAALSFAWGTWSRFDIALLAVSTVSVLLTGYVRRRWGSVFYALMAAAMMAAVVLILYRQVLPALLV